MPFDRRFALPSYNEFDDQLLPECDDCDKDPCDDETMKKCEHMIKWLEEEKKLADMEAHMDDDYEG